MHARHLVAALTSLLALSAAAADPQSTSPVPAPTVRPHRSKAAKKPAALPPTAAPAPGALAPPGAASQRAANDPGRRRQDAGDAMRKRMAESDRLQQRRQELRREGMLERQRAAARGPGSAVPGSSPAVKRPAGSGMAPMPGGAPPTAGPIPSAAPSGSAPPPGPGQTPTAP